MVSSTSNPNPENGGELPEELQPTVLVTSFMVKVMVAPVVDDEDQEAIAEKMAEFFNEHLDKALTAYIASGDWEGLDEADAELIDENVVLDIAD
jgi:hypothetical protein